MIWTKEMKDTLRELAGYKNFSYKDIAKLMTAEYGEGFTKNGCIGMARRIGVPRREPVIKPVIKPKEFTIYDLEWGMCKWPLGEPYDRPPFLYCGKPTGDISCSWCKTHCKRAFSSSSSSSFSSQRA